MGRMVYPELSGYSSRLKVLDVNRRKNDRCTQRFFFMFSSSNIIDARNLAREKNQEKSQKLLIV